MAEGLETDQEVRWELNVIAGEMKHLLLKSSSRRKHKKQYSNQSNSETDGEREGATPERERKKSKVIIKLVQDGASFGEWNPIQLTLSRNNMLGEIEHAKVLRNGSLLIVCKDNVQQMKAIRLKHLDGKKIVVSVMEDKMVRGVVTGIPTVVTVEEIKESVVTEVRPSTAEDDRSKIVKQLENRNGPGR